MNSQTILLGEEPRIPMGDESPDPLRRSTRRPVVLVVDDDEPLREALRLIFDPLFEVRLAGSGAEALSGLQRGVIDVAVVDLRMPGMTGIEFIERLKALDSEVQTIILSGQNTFEMARKAVRLGVYDFLPKPFELQLLRSAVQQAARRRDWLRFERKRESALRQAALKGDAAMHERNLLASTNAELADLLTALSGGLEALQTDMIPRAASESGPAREWQRQVSGLLEQAALTRRLARGTSQAPGGARAEADAAPLFEDLRRLLRAHEGGRRHPLVVRPPTTPVKLLADPVAILRILSNLGRNAREATPDLQPITVESWLSTTATALPESRPDDGCIVLRDSFDGSTPHLVVEVRDTGRGVAPALWRHLFVHPVTTKTGQGDVGLGLSVVRELVLANRCALHLNTHPGVGTSVYLWIPAGADTAASVRLG